MGFLSALTSFLVGGLLVITIIGAPIGLGLIQHAKFLMTPFSSELINKKEIGVRSNLAWDSFSFIARILYFPFGLILAITMIIQIVGLFLSIVGIPLAIILAKSLGTYFNPVNKICVDRFVAEQAYRTKAKRNAENVI